MLLAAYYTHRNTDLALWGMLAIVLLAIAVRKLRAHRRRLMAARQVATYLWVTRIGFDYVTPTLLRTNVITCDRMQTNTVTTFRVPFNWERDAKEWL